MNSETLSKPITIIRRKDIEEREDKERRTELSMMYMLMNRYPESAEKHIRRIEMLAVKNVLDMDT